MKNFTCKKLLKAISFIVLNIAFIVNANSQTWCPAGATWYYTDNSADISGYSKLTYVSDTLINSINCKKITSYHEGTGWQGPYSGYGLPFYTYEQNGVAYLYNNSFGFNKFDTLFNINGQIGDKWRFPLVDTICSDSTYFMKVLNTGTKTLNGFNLKWLYVKAGPFPYAGSGSFIYGFDTITERFGPRYDDICYASCYNSPDECAHGGLRCYSDDTFGVYSTVLTSSCDYLTGITESQIGQEIFKIYPNPTENEITVEYYGNIEQRLTLDLYNLIGERVGSYQLNKGNNTTKIILSDYEAGIYFYKIISDDKIIREDKLIIIKR
ncbi:MAG: T9SS type A sorting domain-containing protein [Bacteroidota bacterium]